MRNKLLKRAGSTEIFSAIRSTLSSIHYKILEEDKTRIYTRSVEDPKNYIEILSGSALLSAGNDQDPLDAARAIHVIFNGAYEDGVDDLEDLFLTLGFHRSSFDLNVEIQDDDLDYWSPTKTKIINELVVVNITSEERRRNSWQ
jgi:hypothetical protein